VLKDAIGAREHTPGQAPASPRLLPALWLYATSQGMSSARALERLCVSHDGYRWLCGGVSVNYHGLADFRSGHGELLDRLLKLNIAALMADDVIELAQLAQDGVRAGGSTSSHRFCTSGWRDIERWGRTGWGRVPKGGVADRWS